MNNNNSYRSAERRYKEDRRGKMEYQDGNADECRRVPASENCRVLYPHGLCGDKRWRK